jgi:hypothetical protein
MRLNHLSVAAFGLMGLASACHTMTRLSPDALAAPSVERVWVTGRDQSTMVIVAPSVNHDTLAGFIGGEYREIPLANITAIRSRQKAPLRTGILVGTVSIAGVATLLYFGNRQYVKSGASTCTEGAENETAVPCCRVLPNTPCV